MHNRAKVQCLEDCSLPRSLGGGQPNAVARVMSTGFGPPPPLHRAIERSRLIRKKIPRENIRYLGAQADSLKIYIYIILHAGDHTPVRCAPGSERRPPSPITPALFFSFPRRSSPLPGRGPLLVCFSVRTHLYLFTARGAARSSNPPVSALARTFFGHCSFLLFPVCV